MKYGYIKDVKTRDNYILGGLSSVPKLILNPSKQWDNFLPDREEQSINGVETYNCTSFGTTSAIEMIMKKAFSLSVNYSDRASGINAGTYPPGNSPHKVAETIRTRGLVLENDLPFKDIDNVDEYYQPSPLPRELRDKAKLWTSQYDFLHEWVDEKDIKEALMYSPIGVAVHAWVMNSKGQYYKPKGQEDNHWCVIYGFDDVLKCWKIFDSYDNTLKLYTYDSEIESAKRYYIRQRSPNEQIQNIRLNLLQVIIQYVKQLINSTSKGIGSFIEGIFSKRN